MAALISSMLMIPRFWARCIIFLIEASLRSISGASPSSTVSTSWGSFFAMLIRRLIRAGQPRQPDSQCPLRRDQALLFFQGLVGQIPLQPFGCVGQGLVHLLRRRDDLDRSGEIASRAGWIAIGSGEGKTHGT